MGHPSREITAHFVHEADARRAADQLDAMFEHYMTLRNESVGGRRWLLTIVLPDDPSLSTFNVDTRLLFKVHEFVEQLGGEISPPEVSDAETRQRLVPSGTHAPSGGPDADDDTNEGDAPMDEAER